MKWSKSELDIVIPIFDKMCDGTYTIYFGCKTCCEKLGHTRNFQAVRSKFNRVRKAKLAARKAYVKSLGAPV